MRNSSHSRVAINPATEKPIKLAAKPATLIPRHRILSMVKWIIPSTPQMVSYLMSLGIVIGLRNPQVLTRRKGKFSVYDKNLSLPCHSPRKANGLALVGDDLAKLIKQAFDMMKVQREKMPDLEPVLPESISYAEIDCGCDDACDCQSEMFTTQDGKQHWSLGEALRHNAARGLTKPTRS